jgi:NAD+ synthase
VIAPETNTSPLLLNVPQTLKVLGIFIHDELRRFGLTKAVLGLSGGVDSALSAFLTARAIGAENLHCVMMPYRSSSPESLTDAQKVIDALGCSSERLEITPMIEPFFEADPEMDKLRKGNVMARMRMIVLYDRSAKLKALVIGTSNKSEGLLGYTTHYGDSACAINPLGDLYKSQVWELAEAVGVPESILKKAPSADLWVGQVSEDELGVKYREIDILLYYMVDCRESDEELVARGFEMDYISKTRTRIRNAQFKRMPPVIAKVAERTINTDFRYPRDWGS